MFFGFLAELNGEWFTEACTVMTLRLTDMQSVEYLCGKAGRRIVVAVLIIINHDWIHLSAVFSSSATMLRDWKGLYGGETYWSNLGVHDWASHMCVQSTLDYSIRTRQMLADY